MTGAEGGDLAATVHALLLARGETVAVAESLTGGLLAATLVGVPGVSATFRGGVVAYATDLKTTLLGVDADLLARVGAVDARVAAALAEGVRQRCGATWGLGTTGVAGPDPQDGLAAGTVHVGVTGPGGADTHPLRLPGGRAEVRAATVTVALGALADRLRAPADGPRAP